MSTETQNYSATYEGNPFGSPDTPELAPPARQADAHRVTVAAVSLITRENGANILRFILSSNDTGVTINDDVWLPELYAVNPKVDPTTLPTSSNFAEDQRGKYASAIHNSKKTATLDRYLTYAYTQGRTDLSALNAATDINQVAEALNTIIPGTELIVTRKPQTKNPDFLNVSGRHDINMADNVKFTSRLSNGGAAVRWME